MIVSSVLYGVVGWFAGRAIGLWQAAVAKARRAHEWVDELSTGDKPFPRDIAWIIFHLINDDRAHVAAAIALEFLEEQEKKL